MSEQVEPGEGWRLLNDEEFVLAISDENYWLSDKSWHSVSPCYHLRKAGTFIAVRRRIPSKPEAVCIDGHTISPDNGFPRFSNAGNPAYYFSSIPESIRQLADWLNRYADWQEAQGEINAK